MYQLRLAHLLVLSLTLSLLVQVVHAEESLPDSALESDRAWHLLGGFGSSHPGWGNTRERVETLDLILRYERPQAMLQGRGWYRNRRSIFIETALHHLESPHEPPMFGLYFQSCWMFRPGRQMQPYLLAGGGPVYTRAEIPGTSSKLKGSYQAGIGLRVDLESSQFSVEYRYHHLSNGGLDEPNDPLNSDKLLLGLKLDL